jgi:hypothetical protein
MARYVFPKDGKKFPEILMQKKRPGLPEKGEPGRWKNA